ncbi:hypothetical protein C8R48DRAFT_782899 [Suillus tomentosus]|nr:hypothetical protein C8R48DRAFT_782899 [Suillus tomentosus]
MIQIIDGSRYPSSLQANVAALQGADDHDHGTIDFAFKAAAILVDILQDPNNFLKFLISPYMDAASYDHTILNAPAPPNPPPPNVSGLSIQQGSFFGFSVEFRVTTQVLGLNSYNDPQFFPASVVSQPFDQPLTTRGQR